MMNKWPGFVVCSRVSTYDEKPCDEAKKTPFVSTERRTVDDPMKNPYIGEAWYKEGRNHRVENGCIARDFDDERWEVEIKDASDLVGFIEKYGPVVMDTKNYRSREPYVSLIIYDDYIE